MGLLGALKWLFGRPQPPSEYRHSSGTVVSMDKDAVLIIPPPKVMAVPLVRMTGDDRGTASARILTKEERDEVMRGF